MNEKYAFVGVQRDLVLNQIMGGNTLYAFDVPKSTCINLDNKTVGTIKEYVNDLDYIFFRVKELQDEADY